MASNSLGLGKLPSRVLERYVLSRLGARSDRVVLGPMVGVDFAAIRLGEGYLIVSSDPVTGALDHVGWIAVNVCANDVATSGNPPRFLQVVLLLPEGTTKRYLSEITREVDSASKKLGLTVVGGHTEVTRGLRHPIVCATCFTHAEKYVSANGARVGDKIILTKTAGLEGTAILGGAQAGELLDNLSVVGEAVEAFRMGGVDAMHDCTEGGVLGALYEMAKASGVGFVVYEDKIPVHPLTRTLCKKNEN
ncbi:MAG: AIR synthase-related protein [Thermoprotei archaeon]